MSVTPLRDNGCMTKSKKKAPGKHYRKGVTLVELIAKFPDDKTAEAWFASVRWPDGVMCGHCEHDNVQHPTRHPTMPYRCRGCRKFFSVRTGTVMADSKLGFQKWAIAVYLFNTNIKGTSSMKLHRDLGISQKSAWHLAHRIRETWTDRQAELFEGPVEADETYIGGLAKNMHISVRHRRIHGRGGVDKTAVVGVKDRSSGQVVARVVESTDGPTLLGFVTEHTARDAMVYTDEHRSYRGLPHHGTVSHSTGQYVNRMAHVNGVESFWAGLKRGCHGTHHHMSAKHLDRYVAEFAGRHNRRPLDTETMMARTAQGMIGKQLPYAGLTADEEAEPVLITPGEPW